MHNEIISVEMPAKASPHEHGTTTGVKAWMHWSTAVWVGLNYAE